MSNSHQPDDVAVDNESSLKALVRAIRLSQEQFRLILARCNYAALMERMVQRLRELSFVKIREILLPKSVKTLYTTIKAQLGDEVPQALMVFGHIAISYYLKANHNRTESRRYWEKARDYLQQCLDIFEQAQLPELVAKYITLLCKVLQSLQAWENLQELIAQKALVLHQKYDNTSQLAQDMVFWQKLP
ncbi:MAG TPA: hypothetical protein V6D11_09940 [Waterburya sp.]|jgi:hypothetical protein